MDWFTSTNELHERIYAPYGAFHAEDPGGERGLLLPVRVGEVESPGLLKTRVYVDTLEA